MTACVGNDENFDPQLDWEPGPVAVGLQLAVERLRARVSEGRPLEMQAGSSAASDHFIFDALDEAIFYFEKEALCRRM